MQLHFDKGSILVVLASPQQHAQVALGIHAIQPNRFLQRLQSHRDQAGLPSRAEHEEIHRHVRAEESFGDTAGIEKNIVRRFVQEIGIGTRQGLRFEARKGGGEHFRTVAHRESRGGHAEAVAALPMPDRHSARLRDAMLDAAMSHAELDRERLNTILAASDAAPLSEELRLEQGLAFSFTRRDAEPERARRDLVLVIDTLAARPGLDAALAAATTRLKERSEEEAFLEQQRLRAARDEADRQLATLIDGDGELQQH